MIVPIAEACPGTDDLPALAYVANPYGQAEASGEDLNALWRNDPAAGAARTNELANATKAAIANAKSAGVDGFVYALSGAEPGRCTPMQYGGQYLEVDREILCSIQDSLVVVLIEGGAGVDALLARFEGEGAYLDFVSDLPAQVFAWDSAATGFSVSEIRALRPGALAAPDADADILFSNSMATLEPYLHEVVS